MMLEPDFYLLGRSDDERRRLVGQARLLTDQTERLLARLRLPQGARAIDLACGPRGALDLLSRAVGPDGAVVGVERSPAFVEAARGFIAAERLGNVEVIEADARATGLPREAFDLVFARLILVNVPDPQAIVDEMAALARPGAVLVSYEADLRTHLCDPPSAAWDRLVEIYRAYSRAHGVDLFVGRKTHRMLRKAGIEDIEITPIIDVFPHGHPRRTTLPDFVENVSGALVRESFITEPALAGLIERLQADLDDPSRIVVSHLFFEVRGRKP